jgi:hypothetical protein
VLRSGAASPNLRCLGHTFAVGCTVLFGYSSTVAVVAAFEAESLGVAAWILGAALTCISLIALATLYVVRRPYTGGYVLVALACLVATVVVWASLAPVLVF